MASGGILLPRSNLRPSSIPRLNYASPQAQGLVGWWPLNGDFRDYSGRNNHGIPYTLAAGSEPTHEVNDIGRHVDFEASGNGEGGGLSADMVLSGLGGDASFSIGIWIEPENLFTLDMFLGYGNDTTDEGVFLYYNASEWRFGIWGGTVLGTTTPTVAAGTRVLLVGTYDKSTMRFYTDGIERANGAESSLTLTAGDIRLSGRISDGGTYMVDADMWHGCIWNRALSASEVWSLYNPATRWDLYWKPRIMVPGFVAAGGIIQGPHMLCLP